MTGASARNWTGYGNRVKLGAGLGDAEKALLTDPQTSGGLLVACDARVRPRKCSRCSARRDSPTRAIIGDIQAGTPRVIVA